jgi:hypothetical protein
MTQADAPIVVRCHGALNDFLPRSKRGRPVVVAFASHETIKHVVEAVGVPHPEIADAGGDRADV